MKPQLDALTKSILAFRDARDWKQFHNPKDLALALSIEASEVNELFLWKSHDLVDKRRLKEELGDVFIYLLLLAHTAGIDLEESARMKLKANARKYPVRKSRGKSTKYTDL